MSNPKRVGVTIPVHVDMNPSLVKFAKAEMRRGKLLRGRLATLVCRCEDSGLYYDAVVQEAKRALKLTEKEPMLDDA
jgi:hypothetical protein